MKIQPKSEFSKNVLTLMTGTTIAQAVPIAISPILTRIYTPEDFGVFALYISIVTFLSLICTGRYEFAIMLPKKDSEAVNILALSVLVVFIISLISFLAIFIFNAQIVALLGSKELSTWLYLIPFSVMLTGVYQSINYWNSRKKFYKRVAQSNVVQSSTIAGTNLGLGFSGFGSAGLIIGSLAGKSIATAILVKTIFKKDRINHQEIKKLKMFALMRKYKKMPMYNLPNALIDGFRLTGITILIAKFFTIPILGQFSLAWKILQLPISLIGASLSQVFFQEISHREKKDLHGIIKPFIVKSFIIALPIFLSIYLYAEKAFIFVFGENWEIAGQVASIMTPWMFLNFISVPLSNVYIVLNRQEIVLMVSVFYMFVPLSLLYFFNDLGFLHIMSLVSFVMSMILVVYIGMIFSFIRSED